MNWYNLFKKSQNQYGKDLSTIVKNLKIKYPGLVLFAWETENKVELATLTVPKNMRGQGIGSSVIREIQEYARSIGKPISLHPEPDKGKKKALDDFYKNLGFVHNRGRNKDFTISSPFFPSMYWKPKENSGGENRTL